MQLSRASLTSITQWDISGQRLLQPCRENRIHTWSRASPHSIVGTPPCPLMKMLRLRSDVEKKKRRRCYLLETFHSTCWQPVSVMVAAPFPRLLSACIMRNMLTRCHDLLVHRHLQGSFTSCSTRALRGLIQKVLVPTPTHLAKLLLTPGKCSLSMRVCVKEKPGSQQSRSQRM